MSKLPKTTEMLHTLTLEQLNELKGQINTMIDLKGGMGSIFKAGQKCHIDSNKLSIKGKLGEIIKVNKTKCKIQFNGIGNERTSIWNVPFNMIELV
tara:strand:- start:1047 stop:1334 length:288 start_codon:yes stop_codon:yes gene_type:complete